MRTAIGLRLLILRWKTPRGSLEMAGIAQTAEALSTAGATTPTMPTTSKESDCWNEPRRALAKLSRIGTDCLGPSSQRVGRCTSSGIGSATLLAAAAAAPSSVAGAPASASASGGALVIQKRSTGR